MSPLLPDGLLAPAVDLIEVDGVQGWGRHGVLAAEKEMGQCFSVDAVLQVELTPAGRSDRLDRTVNYAQATALIQERITGEAFDLIETLAENIAQDLLALSPLIRAVEVTVHKPSAPVGIPVRDVRVWIRRRAPQVQAVLALGTNLGEREARLQRALHLLESAEGISLEWTSPVIETDPVGGPEQGAFLNAVVGVRTNRGPFGLLELAQALERDARRERRVRWGPRTLDVDVICYGDLRSEDEDLTLPHPRAAERAFVLAPWAEVQPEAELPGHGPIGQLLERCADRGGVRPGPVIEGFGAL